MTPLMGVVVPANAPPAIRVRVVREYRWDWLGAHVGTIEPVQEAEKGPKREEAPR